MMSIKLDWEKLCSIHKDLLNSSILTDETKIIFVMMLSDHSYRKSIIKFKDFLNFLWSLSEDNKYKITTLIVKDEEGRIIYRYKMLTNGNEEIPSEGNKEIVTCWNILDKKQRDVYIKLLISQFYGHEK